jgi:hypothetical protein
MSAINLRLPDSLHASASTFAERDNVSLNQFIATAVAEKVSALGTIDILGERAKRGDRAKFLAVLDKAPSTDETKLPLFSVQGVIENQRERVQDFLVELRPLLQASDIKEFATKSLGGDLRYRHANGIYAEIKFYRTFDQVTLRLYFEPEAKPGIGFRIFEKPTSKLSKHDIRLDVGQPINDELKALIVRSREFIRNKH